MEFFKDLLDSGYMLLMMNMFLPFYIRIYLKVSDHTKIVILIFLYSCKLPKCLSEMSILLCVSTNGSVRIPASLTMFLYKTVQ
jgi:hypothetical protein